MFDLIDDLSPEVWLDNGTPPDDLTTVADYNTYVNYNIVNRKISENDITYVVSDDNGKNPMELSLKGLLSSKVDPLKNVRHFRAVITGERNEIIAILLDMDWCVKK